MKKPDGLMKSQTLRVRMTKNDVKAVEKLAKKANAESISDWVRQQLLGAIK